MRVVRNFSLKATVIVAAALAAVVALFPAGVANAAALNVASNSAPQSDNSSGYAWVSYFRQLAGERGVARNATLEAGVATHVRYLANHAQSCETTPHDEQTTSSGSCPANPYATAVGKAAAQNSDITRVSVNSSPRTAVSNWFVSAFHALVLLDPKLASTGYASYYTPSPLGAKPLAWPFTAGVDVYRGRTGSYSGQTIAFPGNNATSPLTTYRVGTESPEPFRTTNTSSPCHAWGSKTDVSSPVIVQWPKSASVNMNGQLVDLSTGRSLNTCTLTAGSYPSGSLAQTFLSGPNGYTKAAFYYADAPFVPGHRYALKTGGATTTTFTVGNLPSQAATSGASGYGSVTAKWAAATAGTGSITKYGVQIFSNSSCSGSPITATRWVGTASRSYTFGGTAHGRNYWVRVTAVNTPNAGRLSGCVLVKSN